MGRELTLLCSQFITDNSVIKEESSQVKLYQILLQYQCRYQKLDVNLNSNACQNIYYSGHRSSFKILNTLHHLNQMKNRLLNVFPVFGVNVSQNYCHVFPANIYFVLEHNSF